MQLTISWVSQRLSMKAGARNSVDKGGSRKIRKALSSMVSGIPASFVTTVPRKMRIGMTSGISNALSANSQSTEKRFLRHWQNIGIAGTRNTILSDSST